MVMLRDVADTSSDGNESCKIPDLFCGSLVRAEHKMQE